jgi:translation initiation factor 2 subunit 1
MLYEKPGFPEDSEVVLCTVTKILPHSVFVVMDEYKKSGMIHISEISPGRIRNLNDFVTTGKKIVCKVLAVRKEQGHIDLSLRRTSEGQRREKVNQLKKEQKAEKIIEFLAKDLKTKTEEVYKEVTRNVFQEYEYLHECFEDIVNEETDIKSLKLPTKVEKPLLKLIQQRMVPPEVTIEGTLTMKSYLPQGVDLIKEAFDKIKDKTITSRYLGAGRYKITIRAKDYELAEEKLKTKIEPTVEFFQEKGGESNFVRV